MRPRYPLTILGVYFTVSHLALILLAYLFHVIGYLLILSYFPARVIENLLSNVFDLRIAARLLMAMLFSMFIAITFLLYRDAKIGRPSKLATILMASLIFVVHPLAFIYQDIIMNYKLGNDPRTSSYLLNTFPISIFVFTILG
jgi:hypothetical protein